MFAKLFIRFNMKFKSVLVKPYAKYMHRKMHSTSKNAIKDQHKIRESLIAQAASTQFGKEHHFTKINNYEDFKNNIPIRDYEALVPYIEKILAGQENVLWKGKPLYFAKTSGTTSGAKYIPITKDSISNHIDGAKHALLYYMAETGNTEFTDGKMIFLSGSPTLVEEGGIPTGRLSGIVNHHIPGYLKTNQLPSYETNCIEDWEQKLSKVIEETEHEDMTLISGIPPWIQMYFDWLQLKYPGKTIKDIFPNLSLIVYGGVNFEPYKAKLFQSIGGPVDTVETFPSSEGFFAFQDKQNDTGLLLNTNSGIFFEFIPLNEINNEKPTRLCLEEVELGVNYAMIINSNAGLWGYNLGDTIKFIDLNPYRLLVTGRIKHFISAFGEHVIGEEVESAMQEAIKVCDAVVREFTVAPKVKTEGDALPHHEWFIEFQDAPKDMEAFSLALDNALRKKNEYYEDLVGGGILSPLRVRALQPKAFQNYMKEVGRLGGQNKAPRLCNDRNVADILEAFTL